MRVLLESVRSLAAGLSLLSSLCASGVQSAELPDLVQAIKPSVVVVGTYSKTRSPAFSMRGTGFVIGNGNQIATNAHVVPEIIDSANGESLAVQTSASQLRLAKIVVRDRSHDLALLSIGGDPMPAMTLQNPARVREGQSIAFMGFPIGGVLGFSSVTHRGIISAITPIALPSPTAQQLNEKVIKRLKEGSFEVYQLDGTAYPGNSGGPLVEIDSGEVIGIINMVFVKSTKESVLSQPSGISFAVPVRYLSDLMRNAE